MNNTSILNKYDRILLLVLIILTLLSIFYIRIINPSSSEKVAIVTHDRKEVLRINLHDVQGTKQYVVQGDNGDVVIEAKQGKIRVAVENSPRNLCSIQGWTDSNVMPIVCLPNKVMIKIVSSEKNDMDSIIK